jgi:hemolysin III
VSQTLHRLTLGPIHNPVRGCLHGAAALLSLIGVLGFLVSTQIEPGVRVALVVFAATQVTLFAASACYHSVPWSRAWKGRMQRVDHAMIYVSIAGAITPIALVGFVGSARWATIWAVWLIAAAGAAQKLFLPRIHERASIPVQISQAALATPALLAFATRFPGAPGRLALLGAAFYAVGAVIFLTERPRLWPRVFSFHELFHVLVVAGSGAYYALAVGFIARLP